MKRCLIIFCFLLGATMAVAQQKALYSQYMTNYYLLNPAVSGYDKDWNFKAGYRNQWVGFEGAPKTYYLSGETALFQNARRRRKRLQPFHGAGGYMYTDNTGPTTQSGVLLSYAYHVPITKDVYLSSGVFAGVQQYKFDANKIHLADGSNGRDPVTSSGSMNAFMPDLSVGVFLHAEEFYFGASLFQVLGNKLLDIEAAETPSRLSRHLFVSGGYHFDLNNNVTLEPSVLLKYVSPAPLQADLNVKGSYSFSKRRRTKYDDKIWTGLSYRTQDALVGLIGVHFLQQYEVSYSYDLTVSPMRHHSAGSHEIMLGLRLK